MTQIFYVNRSILYTDITCTQIYPVYIYKYKFCVSNIFTLFISLVFHLCFMFLCFLLYFWYFCNFFVRVFCFFLFGFSFLFRFLVCFFTLITEIHTQTRNYNRTKCFSHFTMNYNVIYTVFYYLKNCKAYTYIYKYIYASPPSFLLVQGASSQLVKLNAIKFNQEKIDKSTQKTFLILKYFFVFLIQFSIVFIEQIRPISSLYSLYIYIYKPLYLLSSPQLFVQFYFDMNHTSPRKKIKQKRNEKKRFSKTYTHIYDGYIYTYMISSFVYFPVKFAKQKGLQIIQKYKVYIYIQCMYIVSCYIYR